MTRIAENVIRRYVIKHFVCDHNNAKLTWKYVSIIQYGELKKVFYEIIALIKVIFLFRNNTFMRTVIMYIILYYYYY